MACRANDDSLLLRPIQRGDAGYRRRYRQRGSMPGGAADGKRQATDARSLAVDWRRAPAACNDRDGSAVGRFGVDYRRTVTFEPTLSIS